MANKSDYDEGELDRMVRDMEAMMPSVSAEAVLSLFGDAPQEHAPTKEFEQFADQRESTFFYKLIQRYARKFREALTLYHPLPSAEPFHQSRAMRRILRGSNRAGKTLTAAVEVSRILMGRDPSQKRRARDGRLLAVGRDSFHVGAVMFRKIALPGSYWLIRDQRTGQYRSVRPDPKNPTSIDPSDDSRRNEWRPAPPLIEPRHFKVISWEEKKANIPRQTTMHNGWEALWRPSTGRPTKGVDVDVAWFDEELENQEWFPETMARLLDREGIFLWSCTPEAATEHLIALHDMADAKHPGVEEFVLLVADNPYLTAAAKQQFHDELMAADPELLRVKFYAEYALHGLKVYPEFDPLKVHYCPPEQIPREWPRYAAVDPGFQVAATLFIAVNPQGQRIAYDEIYLRGANPEKWAECMRVKLEGEPMLEFNVIDQQMGQQTSMVTQKTVRQHYAEALAAAGIVTHHSGSDFFLGCNNVATRTSALKMLLRHDRGVPRFCVQAERVPNFCREMKGQYYRKNSTDKRVNKNDHLVACAEYLAAEECPFVKRNVAPEKPTGPSVVELLKEKQKREKLAGGGSILVGTRLWNGYE